MAFFSSQDEECNSGMVGIINPDEEHTLDDYRERASEVADRGNSPPRPYGGELVSDSDDDDNNDDGDDGGEDDSDNASDGEGGDGDDEGAAAVFGVPVAGLLSAVAVAFALA